MAVVIRLRREGAKDRPFYKIVAADKRFARDGRIIEQLGTYNPMTGGDNTTLDLEKVDKWISTGAKPSETVASIIKRERKKADRTAVVDEA
ncbi:MAG: small subunit ribosomal protein S16 [Verrucomicrobiales bacterium]|jgi:small subunit ribosomal protein S16